jgi:hypothetical protein
MTSSLTRNLKTALRAGAIAAALLSLTACSADMFESYPFGDNSLSCNANSTGWRDWRPGCATERNVAAVAENPKDLRVPRGEGQRDSARRDGVLSSYLKGRMDKSAGGQTASGTEKSEQQ